MTPARLCSVDITKIVFIELPNSVSQFQNNQKKHFESFSIFFYYKLVCTLGTILVDVAYVAFVVKNIGNVDGTEPFGVPGCHSIPSYTK